MVKILFVCVHNSIRSQMAEGLARHFGKGIVEAYSAGLYATGVNPKAIEVMKEIGIDISNQRSKVIEEFKNIDFDYVISLCDEMEENCPYIPGAKRLHWPTPDPGKTTGTPEEVYTAFCKVRDNLKERILDFLSSLSSG